MSATPTTLQGNRKKIDKMNKTELREEVKIHRKNEAQYKENLTNLRKKINEIKKELKQLRLLKEKYSPQDNLTTRMIAIEKRITEQEQFADEELWNSLVFLITPTMESLRTQLSKHSEKRESK